MEIPPPFWAACPKYSVPLAVKNFVPMCILGFLLLQFVPIASDPVTGCHREESGSAFPLSGIHSYTLIGSAQPGHAATVLPASLEGSCSTPLVTFAGVVPVSACLSAGLCLPSCFPASMYWVLLPQVQDLAFPTKLSFILLLCLLLQVAEVPLDGSTTLC